MLTPPKRGCDMGWLGRGLEGLKCTGEPVYVLDGNNGYDGPHVRKVTIACEVAAREPTATPGVHCAHARFRLYGWTDKPTEIADRRLELAPTFLQIHRRRMHCQDCDSYLVEEMPGVQLGHDMTRRLYDDIFHAAVNRPFEDAARLHGVSADTVRRIFRKSSRDILGDFQPELPPMIAIDETKLAGQMRFVCNCLTTRTLVDILPNKTPVAIKNFLRRNSNQGHVQVVVQDMNGNYRDLVREVLGPKVTIVIDRYHVVDALNRAMNKARIAATPRRGGKDTNTKRAGMRKLGPLLLKNHGEMTLEERAEMRGMLRAEPELRRAWLLKEGLKGLYGLRSAEQAAKRLDRLDARYGKRWTKEMLPMGRALEMVRNYQQEILNWHRVMQDNGRTEAMNKRYQLIDVDRAGLKFETLRAKALLRYGGYLDEWYLSRV